MSKFYIVPHTHWDREWHKTFEEYRVRCVDFFDNLLEVLENTDFPCFVLDGQTSVVLDYLDVKPQNEERIKDLVKMGKLKIGPWYVQPDENIPSLESLIKNLLVSANIGKRFGGDMQVGYLPDSFGQGAAMPTILKGFGIDSAVFYRGFSEDQSQFNQFNWQGIDSCGVMAYWLKTGYGNGMFLSGNLENDVAEILNTVEFSKGRQGTDKYLILAGSDQCFLKAHLVEAAKNLQEHFEKTGEGHEFVVCGLEEFFAESKDDYENLATLNEELRFGKRNRVHISIGGTRQDIKKKNFHLEKLYEKSLEPICAISSKLGGNYPKEMIERGVKYYLENHAHDSICCVCTDFVHSEIVMRMDKASQIATSLLEKVKHEIHSKIKFKNIGRPVLLFSSGSPDGVERVEFEVSTKSKNFIILDTCGKTIEHQVLTQTKYNLKDTIVALSPVPDDWYFKSKIAICKDLSYLGYETFYVKEIDGDEENVIRSNENFIENQFLKVKLNERGSFTITHKLKNEKYENQFRIVDMGNAGDEYDYSPPNEDKIFSQDGTLVRCWVEKGKVLEKLTAKYEMWIPKTTDGNSRHEELEKMDVELSVTLTSSIERIDVSTKILNRSENHRVCVEFTAKNKTAMHFASTQNGVLERKSHEDENTQKSIEEKWSEVYYPIYPLNGYVNFPGEMSIFSKGQVQYQTFKWQNETKIWLTLLTSVSNMGNENLKLRPGRRSGAVCETKDSKMIGEYVADFGISFEDDCDKGSRNYYTETDFINLPITKSGGIFADSLKIIDSPLEISSFKMAEDGDGLILRLICRKEGGVKNCKIHINKNLFGHVEVVNLKEEKIKWKNVEIIYETNQDMSDKRVFAGTCLVKEIKNGEILTLRLR